MKIPISIIGATGYTGLELLRILINHPNVEIKNLVSNSKPDKEISSIYPHLKDICEKKLEKCDLKKIIKESETIFLALPHGKSKDIVPEIINETKIIDLASDFRLNFPTNKFIYGLPELNKEEIKKSNYIANPGCFATACQLALLPLKGKIKETEILGITGSTGSGKNPQEGTHHPIRDKNVKSYKIGTHQHVPEIIQSLELKKEQINFVPTSGPFTRGIHLTAFVTLNQETEVDYQKFYKNDPFIRIKDSIQLADVIGSNYCDISITKVNNKLVIQTVIDNLMKGAAGTAVQNFNLMNNLEQNTGLNILPLYP